MDRPAASYCSTRRDLENRSWALTSRLFDLSGRLTNMAGLRKREFSSTHDDCEETKGELAELHQLLEAHRSKHGC